MRSFLQIFLHHKIPIFSIIFQKVSCVNVINLIFLGHYNFVGKKHGENEEYFIISVLCKTINGKFRCLKNSKRVSNLFNLLLKLQKGFDESFLEEADVLAMKTNKKEEYEIPHKLLKYLRKQQPDCIFYHVKDNSRFTKEILNIEYKHPQVSIHDFPVLMFLRMIINT
jgi:hypothetical protein